MPEAEVEWTNWQHINNPPTIDAHPLLDGVVLRKPVGILCLGLMLILVLCPWSGRVADRPTEAIDEDVQYPVPVAPNAQNMGDGCHEITRYFIENQGQKGPGAGEFYRSGGRCTIALGRGWVSYLVRGDDGTRALARVSFKDANDVMPVGRGFAGHMNNYFIGNDPDLWITGVRCCSGVVYYDLWEGIDLRFGIKGGFVKYEYVVSPGGDPASIRLDVEGHDCISIGDDGTLTIQTAAGPISDGGLIAFYQDDHGDLIPCRFKSCSRDSYGYSVGEFDPGRTVVIDPLVYSTILNGEWYDEARGLDVDSNGSAYLVGRTYSDFFPITPGVYKPSKADDDRIYDGFVTKMSPNGTSLVYSTFLGGNKLDVTSDIFIDPDGSAYILG